MDRTDDTDTSVAEPGEAVGSSTRPHTKPRWGVILVYISIVVLCGFVSVVGYITYSFYRYMQSHEAVDRDAYYAGQIDAVRMNRQRVVARLGQLKREAESATGAEAEALRKDIDRLSKAIVKIDSDLKELQKEASDVSAR